MIVAGLSTVVEWYDFTLYLYLATVLSRVFFGGGDNAMLATLAGFAVSYLMRPLGALCFGHLGDRFGRRYMLLASMLLMTLAMLATALLPTFDSIGASAGVLLLLLRCLMAFSVVYVVFDLFDNISDFLESNTPLLLVLKYYVE